MSEYPYPVFTIGHSTLDSKHFIGLLRRHKIEVVADVRSVPYSAHVPQFDRERLAAALQEEGIHYVFLGKELGGRPNDPSCYDESGRVQYERVAQTNAFRLGIKTVLAEARTKRIALMCSEKDPLNCHRALLVAQTLHKSGVVVLHIWDDGTLETHEHALERLQGTRKALERLQNENQALERLQAREKAVQLSLLDSPPLEEILIQRRSQRIAWRASTASAGRDGEGQ